MVLLGMWKHLSLHLPCRWYDMKRKNTLDNNKNEIHMKYHRTVEGEICDITQIQSHLLGGCFVSIQVYKPFESDAQLAPCRCQHIKCPLQPVSNLLLWQSAGWEVCTMGLTHPCASQADLQLLSEVHGQFEKVKKWNGEHLIDSRYKNHQ